MVQRLLREMGLVRTVLIFGLQIDYHLMEKIGNKSWALESVTKQSRDMLVTVCKRTVFSLNGFISNNTENQEILYKNLDLLR